MKTIAAREKRLLKLRRYFRPYQSLRLKENTQQAEPIILKPLLASAEHEATTAGATESEETVKYQVSISPLLFTKDSPEWMEASVLRFCLLSLGLRKSGSDDETIEEIGTRIKDYFQQVYSEHVALFKTDKDATPVSLEEIWRKIRADYFPDRDDLDRYQLHWSNRRQTRSLATCSVAKLRVDVAAALNSSQLLPVLEPLLYHEMCHAYLGEPRVVRGRRVMHGKEFKQLERRHPKISFLDNWIENGGWDEAVKACNLS